MNKVLVISGLTATGKSKLAIEWAQAFNGEIISVDSVAVYKQLSIASAKPSLQQQQIVKHHAIDLVDVNQSFSVMQYQQIARELISTITNQNKLPILVGGSGLYLKAVLTDYQFHIEDQPDSSWTEQYSNQELHQMLELLDPQEANTIHVNNRRRLVRALVLIKQANQSKTQLKTSQHHQLLYDVFMVCADLPREQLHQAIDQRVDQMIEAGLQQEIVEALKLADFDAPSMQAIGVREWKDVFSNSQSVEATINAIKTHTKQFSKRQRTWFKHQHDCHWIMSDNKQAISDTKEQVKAWLKR